MLDCLVATAIPSIAVRDHPTYLAQLASVMVGTAGVHRTGSTALDLAYVAAGRYDGCWERGVKSWDIVAGALLVREAGGFVTDFAGKDGSLSGGEVLAGNEAVHRGLLKVIQQARPA